MHNVQARHMTSKLQSTLHKKAFADGRATWLK